MAIFIRLLGLMCRGAQHWTDFVVRNAVRNYQEATSVSHMATRSLARAQASACCPGRL